ncbi:MAG TPA: hypothetical protein VM096_19595, partial [Vicinamibacterales bacterium]|nr:hypothetical protein [Vicinamibacterales bacterium]
MSSEVARHDPLRTTVRRPNTNAGTSAISGPSHRRRLGVDSRHQEFIMSTVYTMTRTPDLLPGTLDLLILRALQKD